MTLNIPKKIKIKGEYCCDFETTPYVQYIRDGFTKVYLFKIVNMRSGEGSYGVSIEEFFDYIWKHPDIEKIYFHNLSFDGSFIMYYLLKNKWKWREKLQGENGKSFSTIIDDFGSIYEIKINNDYRLITINCSYKLIGLSIKDLGKLVGLDKLNETHNYNEFKDYTKIEEYTKEELSYIDNDVEIMRRAIIECYMMGIRGMTRASACYRMWKSMSWNKVKEYIVPCDDDRINHIINSSYRGGITMINPKFANKEVEDCRDYDVNSLYPSQMYNKMPVGYPIFTKDESTIAMNYDLRIYEVYIEEAKVIDGYIPFIPTTKSFIYKDAYDYPKGIKSMSVCLWGDEFKLFKMYYKGTYRIVNIVAYKSINGMFDDYLNKFKKIKEEAPNPSPERQFAKLCMNNLYGKFAQTSSRVSKEPFIDDEGNVYFKNYTTDSGNNYDRKIASIITSYARCVLIKAINKAPERFIYCDTDSIYIKGDYGYDIPIDDKKLGFWKYEYSYYKFKGLKAKCYMSTIKPTGEIHSAVSGLPKEAQKKLTFETFKDGLMIMDAKRQQKRVKGGIVIVSIPFTIKVKKDDVVNSEGN